MQGVTLTLLIGHVAAGHSRPDDSWKGSVISGSLHFSTCSGAQPFQNQLDSGMSDDLEAQRQRNGKYDHHILADSQGDMGSDNFVHEDDSSRSQCEETMNMVISCSRVPRMVLFVSTCKVSYKGGGLAREPRGRPY